MNNSKLMYFFKFCRLLENDGIRKEVEEQLKGYSLEVTYQDERGLHGIFIGNDNKKIILTFCRYEICLSKQSNNMVELIDIDKSLVLSHKIIEKRPNGVIYSNIYKNFNFNKDAVCIIEWSDMICDCLPEERLQIKFKIIDENTRVLILEPYGQKYEDLVNSVL